MRVLIVEKDETMVFILSKLFCAYNPRCVVVSSPDHTSAIETLNHQLFDIMLATPDEEGSDALAVLRHARHRYPELIILIMTDILNRHQHEAFRHGANYCFAKGTPNTSHILAEAVSQVERMYTTRPKR